VWLRSPPISRMLGHVGVAEAACLTQAMRMPVRAGAMVDGPRLIRPPARAQELNGREFQGRTLAVKLDKFAA